MQNAIIKHAKIDDILNENGFANVCCFRFHKPWRVWRGCFNFPL